MTKVAAGFERAGTSMPAGWAAYGATWVAAALLAFLLSITAAPASSLKSDEEVIFFPTAGHLSEDSSRWVVPIHAWVFEPERDSLLRKSALAAAAAALGLDRSAAESDIFRQRAAWFLVDSERGKRIDLTLSTAARDLGPSHANGHLFAEIAIERRIAGPEPAPFWLRYALEPPNGDTRNFTGDALLVPRDGLSVISDIDDTVKLSEVRDKKALLENSFLKPFVAAPGMAALYRDFVSKGAAIHYVSSSPWQLYPPLKDFFDEAELPNGSFHLKSFRLKDESFLDLFASARETKPAVIENLLARFPDRKFILVGDSGEADPEIYGDVARRFPDQVRAIVIRNVTAESADDARYQGAAFKDLPSDLWLLFDTADMAGAFLKSRI
ncbi:MAG: App1 family protein [Alphaproteobacteria bacterium]|nr:App1 family protein [Alphaproteobacteria bacterium]